jgi:hypothetical protein
MSNKKPCRGAGQVVRRSGAGYLVDCPACGRQNLSGHRADGLADQLAGRATVPTHSEQALRPEQVPNAKFGPTIDDLCHRWWDS